MDKQRGGFDHSGMKKPVRKRPPKAWVPVYLGEWLSFLGVAPVELVKAGVISEGYLSLLRNGKRVNPSPGKLMQIGTFLGIEWTDLYRSPPRQEAVSGFDGLSETTVQRIRARRRS